MPRADQRPPCSLSPPAVTAPAWPTAGEGRRAGPQGLPASPPRLLCSSARLSLSPSSALLAGWLPSQPLASRSASSPAPLPTRAGPPGPKRRLPARPPAVSRRLASWLAGGRRCDHWRPLWLGGSFLPGFPFPLAAAAAPAWRGLLRALRSAERGTRPVPSRG